MLYSCGVQIYKLLNVAGRGCLLHFVTEFSHFLIVRRVRNVRIFLIILMSHMRMRQSAQLRRKLTGRVYQVLTG